MLSGGGARPFPWQGPRGDFHQQTADRHVSDLVLIDLNSHRHQLQHPVEAVQPRRTGTSRHADDRHAMLRHQQVAGIR